MSWFFGKYIYLLTRFGTPEARSATKDAAKSCLRYVPDSVGTLICGNIFK